MYSEHAVPPGALVVERKYCEICGRSFSRRFAATEVYAEYIVEFAVMLHKPPLEVRTTLRKDHGERFCGSCKARQLMPDVEAQLKYLIQLPGTPQQMRHAPHVPKYDKALFPKEGRHDGPRRRRSWIALLSPMELRVAEKAATTKVGYIAIAAELGVGADYVKAVAARVYKVLDVRGREQLMSLWACELYRAGVLALSERPIGGAGRANRPDVAPGGPCDNRVPDSSNSRILTQQERRQPRPARGTRSTDAAPRAEH